MIESKKTFNIGDKISYGFNGDCTPDGVVARITPTGKILYSDSGNKYVLQSDGFYKLGGCWSLIKGHYDERNPSF